MAAGTAPIVTVRNFAPLVDGQPLIAGIDLDIIPGSVTGILGPSGIGKTSTFRAILGHQSYAGYISHRPKIWSVYQTDNQMFPWTTVRTNMKWACKKPWQQTAQDWGILDKADCKPQYLSVGQRQRFTLLRAACSGAAFLLCDEPLSAVDGINRISIAKDIRRMAHDMKLAVLWITHDINECVSVADQCVVLSTKKCINVAAPLRIQSLLDILHA